MRKMKILMTTMAMDIGGAETHILELSRELCARGHDVTVASNGGAYVEELVACGARHVELPLNTKMIHSAYRAYRGLQKLIEGGIISNATLVCENIKAL